MIFPSDSEIREYGAYEVRTRKIILEEFKHEYGRDPNELEIPELLRAAIIPIGFLPKQNGQQKLMQDQAQTNSNAVKNEAKTASPEQPKNQPAQTQKHSPTESVMDIVNAHKDRMRIDGERVVLTGKIDDYWAVVDEFKQRKWKHIPAEKLSNGKWKDGYFEPVGARA